MIAGESGRLAKVLLAVRAIAAPAARVPQPGDANPTPHGQPRLTVPKRFPFFGLAGLRIRKRRTELVDRADDLMARDDRHFLLRQIALDHMQVGSADGAAVDANAHLARPGLGRRHVRPFQGRLVDRSDPAQQHGFHGNSPVRKSWQPEAIFPPFALVSPPIGFFAPRLIRTSTASILNQTARNEKRRRSYPNRPVM